MAKKKQQPKGGTRQKYNIKPEDFCRAWQTSDSPQEVAEKLGMPKAIVLARASAYRSDGVNLKKMKRRSRRTLDIEGLNRLVEAINEGREGDTEVQFTAPETVKRLLAKRSKK